jgi:hypothetical protein
MRLKSSVEEHIFYYRMEGNSFFSNVFVSRREKVDGM